MSMNGGAYTAPKAKHQLSNEVVLNEVQRMLNEGRDVVMVPKGRSMLPFIRGEMDKVLLRKPTKLKVGDIALAQVEDHYVMHRVIAIDNQRVTLMGDGNLQGTEQTTQAQVAGVVVEIITPEGRHHTPTRGRLWRTLLPVRKYLLKIYRKWNKLRASSRILRPEVSRQ